MLDYLNKTISQHFEYHGKFKIIHLNAENATNRVTVVICWIWNHRNNFDWFYIVEAVILIRYTLFDQGCMNYSYNTSFDQQAVKVVYVTATLQRPLCTRLKRSIFYDCSNVT